MRFLVAGLCLALIAVPAASAKGRIVVRVGDRTPTAGQSFAVTVRTDFVVPANDWLRLIAVAPGKNWYDVIRTIDDSSLTHARNPRDGFEIRLERTAPRTWRALVRLPRPGHWRLVLPNGTHSGYMVSPPAAWMPWVEVHR